MIEATDSHLDLWTAITPKERKRALTWFASLPEAKRVEIYEAAIKRNFQLKQGHPGIAGGARMRYSAFICAIREAGFDLARGRGLRGQVERQVGPEDVEALAELRRLKARNLRRDKPSPKKRAVMAYWGEVKELRQEGIGFQRIAKYLGTHRQVKVSPAYINKLWQELEGAVND